MEHLTDNYSAINMTDGINVQNLEFKYNSQTILKDVNINLQRNNIYCLLGVNGSGKTTLMNILYKILKEQKNSWVANAMIIAQEQYENSVFSVETYKTLTNAMLDMNYKYKAWSLELKNILYKKSRDIDTDPKRESELKRLLEINGPNKAKDTLRSIGFAENDLNSTINERSGGWRKRLAIAAVIYTDPDIILLDEPTNHLDTIAKQYLEDYLQYCADRNKIIVITSHDVNFLDNVCNKSIVIDNGELLYFNSNASEALAKVNKKHLDHNVEYVKLQKFIDKRVDKDTTADDVIKKHNIQRDKLKAFPQTFITFKLSHMENAIINRNLITLEDVSFAYPPKIMGIGAPFPVLSDINFAIDMSSRYAICGKNGAGKSTLMNLITGKIVPTSGVVTRSDNIRIAKYDQHFIDLLCDTEEHAMMTPVVRLMSLNSNLTLHDAHSILGPFKLHQETKDTPIRYISGGQKARVAFAILSMSSPHLILMDEPTNHLDHETIQALINAINSFKGGFVAITHDEAFIKGAKLHARFIEDGQLTE